METRVTTAKLRLRLEEILKEQGRSKKWLAEQMGVSRHSVRWWCNKKHGIRRKRIPKMAEVLGIEKHKLYATSDI